MSGPALRARVPAAMVHVWWRDIGSVVRTGFFEEVASDLRSTLGRGSEGTVWGQWVCRRGQEAAGPDWGGAGLTCSLRGAPAALCGRRGHGGVALRRGSGRQCVEGSRPSGRVGGGSETMAADTPAHTTPWASRQPCKGSRGNRGQRSLSPARGGARIPTPGLGGRMGGSRPLLQLPWPAGVTGT